MATTERENHPADALRGAVNVELRQPEPPKTSKHSTARNALDELVRLLTGSTAREHEIDQALEDEQRKAEREATKAENALKQAFQARHDELQQRFEQQAREIETQSEAALEEAGESSAGLKRQVELDTESAETQVRQRLQQAEWLAESVYEGATAQAEVDFKQTNERVSTQLEAIDAIEAQAHQQVTKYGHAAMTREAIDVPPPQPVADAEQAAANFEQHRDAAHLYLGELTGLAIPRLFIGIRYPVLVAILCVLAGFIAQGIGGQSPAEGLAGFELATQAILIGVGATLAICVLGGFALYYAARSQVRNAYIPLRRESATARQAAEVELKTAREHRDVIVSRAEKKRQLELSAARDRFSPLVQRAEKNRQDALNTVHGEIGSRLSRIEGERDQKLLRLETERRSDEQQLQSDHERELAALRKSVEDRKRQREQTHASARQDLLKNWEQGLKRIQAPISDGGGQAVAPTDWEDSAWASWTPSKTFPSQVRIGQMRVDLKQIEADLPGETTLKLPGTFAVPALLTFPTQGSLLVQADSSGRKPAIRVLQMAMARLLTSFPAGRVRFTIIDPIGLGQNFAGFMHLADHDEALVGPRIWTDAEQIDQRIKDLTEHMETVIQKYLRNEYQTIDEYNAQAGELAEPYRYLVIADLPHNFSPEALRRLNSIASTGARCGVYILVMRDLREQLSGGHIDEVEAHSVNLLWKDGRFIWNDTVFQRFPLELDPPPEESTLTKLLDVVGRHAKEAKRVEVPFEQISPATDDGQMWSWDTAEELKVPIGRLGATRQQMLRLGKGVAQHALIAGKTGSGKSTLLHVLVTNLAMWYPPDEVQFYLVDFKKGVEFKTYATHHLPHARAIAVESDREFGLSVLQRVDAELTRRGAIFREAGVQDLPGYRRSTGKKMPRILLIIDEFQEFFTEDDKLAQDAGLLLDRLVRQGRAFGIHLILGSQTIGGTSGLARSTIGQMAVRIALQTSEADAHLILSDNNSAARLLTRPGEAIYNDAGGLVEANSPFQIAWLNDERRDEYLDAVIARQSEAPDGASGEPPIVFEGNLPADITENRRLAEVLRTPRSGNAAPSAPRAWLGEPVAIKDPTAVVFRRQSGANMLIIGQAEEGALSLMMSSVISLSAQHPPGTARFYVLDGTPADSVLHGRFPQLAGVLPEGQIDLVEFRAVDQTIAELHAEMQKRLDEGAGAELPSLYLVIYGLQRYRVLRKSEDSFGGFSMGGDEEKKPQPDKQFIEILKDGAGVGVHVLAWIDTSANIDRTLDRSAMREFDWRVLFQMSANDSSNLIDSPVANKLGFHRALAYSEEQGVTEKFRPYALPGEAWLNEVKERLIRN